MAADLKSISTFQRYSLVLMNDCLIKLEHERTQDRVRRYSYDTIQQVLIWRKVPWLRIIICLVALVLPGIAIFFARNITTTVIGCFLLASGGTLVIYYSYCKATTIRIIRGGRHHDSEGLFRPGRLRRFEERFVTKINEAQLLGLPEVSNEPVATRPAALTAEKVPAFENTVAAPRGSEE